MLRQIAHSILPKKQAPRRLPFGLAKGQTANVDFRYDAAYYFGRHEPDLFPYYRRLIYPGMRCFDLGTYRGWDALNLAYLSQGQVVSFDGNPKMTEAAANFLSPFILRHNINLVSAFFDDAMTLDRASKEFGFPDFIKMDIEGAESEVLKRASATLAKRPKMIIETHGESVEDECFNTLWRLGYAPEIVTRSRFLSEARGMEHNRWIVCS